MKAMSKVLVLAAITLMSASAFAADAKVGQNKESSNCAEGTQLVQKKQTEKDAPAAAPANNGNANHNGNANSP